MGFLRTSLSEFGWLLPLETLLEDLYKEVKL